MDTFNEEEIDRHSVLYQLFGSTRAEWLGEQLYELFTEPGYFPELQTNRPCFLVGGRGTGKTTVLRSLSFQGQAALQPDSNPRDWGFFGLYHRVDTNRVTAFSGEELTDDRWSRLFGHYLNLTFTLNVVTFIEWFENRTGSNIGIPDEDLKLVSRSLVLDEDATDISELGRIVRVALVEFEASINNVADEMPRRLSLLGAPVDQLVSALKKIPVFEKKPFFFLVDEYENYLEYQQRVLNTLIKHAGMTYTFKIGVRQLGLKVRTTLNSDEQLMYPADYALIEIEERLAGDFFKTFATQVCQGRLDLLAKLLSTDSIAVWSLLPGISEEEEACLLGVESEIEEMRKELPLASEELQQIENLPYLQAYLFLFWSRAHGTNLANEIQDFKRNPVTWHNRYQNYKHVLLYTLRRGKTGVKKYYCGWETFLLVSNSNIRYALELVYESLKQGLEHQGAQLEPVSRELQTAAAQSVGARALRELEGVSIYGAQLTKLVLGLGRVFNVMATHPEGHAPEVNQFYLNPIGPGRTCRQTGLLEAAVMHLALVRSSGTKLIEHAATQEYDYWLHPVFAPFFVYSHRRKRKMQLDIELLEGLIERPRPTIRHILSGSSRPSEEDLPEQLRMFEGYYASS